MKRSFAIACLILALSVQALADEAGMAKAGDIMIHDSWARASLGSVPNSAVYMTLMTHGAIEDRLIGAATPIAEKAELHTHVMDGDVARMRPVEVVEVVPGEPTTLEPGGSHVMLIGLKEKLEEGKAFPLTLIFETAGEVTLAVPIRALRDEGRQSEAHKHGG